MQKNSTCINEKTIFNAIHNYVDAKKNISNLK